MIILTSVIFLILFSLFYSFIGIIVYAFYIYYIRLHFSKKNMTRDFFTNLVKYV